MGPVVARQPQAGMSAVTSYQRALECINKGELQQAREYLVAVTPEDPDYLKALNKLGVVWAKLKHYQNAQASFFRAISIDPEFAPAYNNLGNIAKTQGQVEEAIKFYQRALACAPDFAAPHNNLAVIYKEQGKYALFVKELKTAHRLQLFGATGDGLFTKIRKIFTGEGKNS